MSIVLEALEKAQREGIKEEKKEIFPQEKISGDISGARKRSRSRYNIYIWIGILCVAGLNLWLLGWWLNTNRAIVSVNVSTPISIPPAVYPVLQEEEILPISQEEEILPVSQEKEILPETGYPVLTVTGIVWDPQEPIALISGKFFKEGDEVLGTNIKKIQVDRVIFSYKDEEYTIPVQR